MNKIKTFYSTKRVQKIIISLLTVILIVSGVSFATLYTPTKASKTDVSITLTSKDIKEKTDVKVNVVMNGNVEVLKDGKLVEDLSMTINEPTKLSMPLEAGKYTVRMTSAPIESDGSIYKIPSKIDDIVIPSDSSKAVNVEVLLEKIAVGDMTKEQLGIAIERLEKEAPDKSKDLIETLKKRQETAVSDKSSIKDIQQESQAKEETPKEETPKEETPKPENKPNTDNSGSSNSGSSNSGSGGSGSSSGSTTEKHVHSFTKANIIHHAEVPAQGYNETIPAITQDHVFFLFDDGCKFEKKNSSDENAAIEYNHNMTHGFQGYRAVVEKTVITPESTHWVETAPAIPAWDETDGYFCSCGAYRSK